MTSPVREARHELARPGPVTEPIGDRPQADAALWRVRLVAGVVLLAAVSFRQSGGLVVPDTKLDLTADPGAFLGRALNMWDPSGAFGQLQNQAYGYLFPVGPFHWLLTEVGVPAWVVQRLWWTVVLSTAFLGLWRLAGALGLGAPWSRYVAALLFALSPRLVSEVAVTSVEVWPMAVAPWVLLPLVDPRERALRRRVAWSALAFAAIGGVNAVAAGAALVLPTLWFATRRERARAGRQFLAWLGAVLAVSTWWLVPLVLLGRYSPPFLDWIENAPVTTAFASPFEALRGTTAWLGFLSGAAGPSWPAGWQFVTSPALIVASTLLAAAGLVGVALAPRRIRSFLVTGLLVGLLLVTAGHTGSAGSPLGGTVQEALDGALAPLRNTHKFELVVRVPLALGLVVVLARATARVRGLGLSPWLVPVAAFCMVGLMAAPAVNGDLARPEGYRAIPGYWREAARWLDERPEPGTVLVVPAAGFADFEWGSTKDEPLQSLSSRPFAVRDAVPLGSAGATRWLDVVERSLQSGAGGDRLRNALTDAGIRHVVVRNDLRADAADFGGGQALRVHEALSAAGLQRVRTFGPPQGPPADLPAETSVDTVDRRTRLAYPALEVFAVDAPHEARLVDAGDVVAVAGAAEDVADVRAATGAGAVVVGSDVRDLPPALRAAARRVVTDGNHDREVFFGRASNNTSAVLGSGDPPRTGRAVDRFVADADAPRTVRVAAGDLLAATASSSASDANASLRLGPGYGPQAAVDGDPATAWVSGRFGASAGEWLELRLARPGVVEGLRVTLESAPRRVGTPAEVRVETDRGVVSSRVLPVSVPQPLSVPTGRTARVRVTVTATVEGDGANGVGIAELTVPGLRLGTRLAVPAFSGQVDAVVFRRADDGRRQCSWVVDRPLCTPTSLRQGENEAGIRRLLDLGAPLTGPARGTVAVRPGPAAERLLTGLTSATVQASSRAVREAAGRPAAAMDGNLGTGWVAAPDDSAPTLRIRLPRSVSVDRVQLQRDPFLAASTPRRARVVLDDGPAREVTVDAQGYLRWPMQRLRTLDIRFTESVPLRSTDSVSGLVEVLPVGVSEVVVPGVDPRGPLTQASTTGAECGFGPALVVAGRTYATSVTGTVEEVLAGRALRWETCGDDPAVLLPAGQVGVEARASAEFEPTTLTLASSSLPDRARPVGEPSRALAVRRDGPGHLDVSVPAASAETLVVVPQNHSGGWVAQDEDGRELTPVRVSGWQQGWVLPPGEERTITARFAPDALYRAGLVLGGALLVGVLALAVSPAPGRRSRPLPPASPGPGRWNLGVVGALVFLAGLPGAVAAAGVLVAWRAGRAVVATVVVVASGLGAVLVAAAPVWPASRAGVDDPVVQVMVLLAVAATAGTASTARVRDTSPRRPRRMIGRSTR